MVPPEVLIPAGATTTSFPITTIPVNIALSVPIAAGYAGIIQTATLTVTP